MKKKLTLPFFCLSLFCALLFSTCKKDNIKETDTQLSSSSREEILFKWGQAHNGRWLPYVLDKIKEDHPKATGKEMLALLDSYMEPVNNALNHYTERLNFSKAETEAQRHKSLEDYYLKDYENINKSLAIRKDMDNLYLLYKQLKTKQSVSNVGFKSKMANTNPLNDVEITACAIPWHLQSWIAMYFGNDFWSLHAIGVVHSHYGNEQRPECRERLSQFISAVVQFADKSRVNSPTQSDCEYNLSLVEDALAYYRSCPNATGTSPDDPFPQGGGGGGTNPTSPFTNSSYYSEADMQILIDNLEDPITGDGIELYLIANYKGSKLIDLSQYSTSNGVMAGEYTLIPHYDKRGQLLFYAASRSGLNGIEYIVRPNQLTAFKTNVEYYTNAANLVYLNGVPSQAMIKIMSGDRATGLFNLWGDALKSPEYYMYLASILVVSANSIPERIFIQTEKDGNLLFFSTRVGNDVIEFGGNFSKINRTLIIDKFDIDGQLTNKLGIRGLKDVITAFGKQQGVDEIIIRGATRTTGASPGRVPGELIFKIKR